jgi:hypothetical protein
MPVKVSLRRAELTTSAPPQGLQSGPVTTERMNNTHHYDHPLIDPTYQSNSITSQRKLSNKKGSILPGYSPQTDESTYWNKNILLDPNKRNQFIYKAPLGVSNNFNSKTNISQALELETESRNSNLYENLRKRGETSMTFRTNICIPVKSLCGELN